MPFAQPLRIPSEPAPIPEIAFTTLDAIAVEVVELAASTIEPIPAPKRPPAVACDVVLEPVIALNALSTIVPIAVPTELPIEAALVAPVSEGNRLLRLKPPATFVISTAEISRILNSPKNLDIYF